MRKVIFYGWQVGMRKIPFSLLLREETGLALKEAYESMLRVFDEQPVTLEVADELAERLLAQVLGVKCCLEPASL
jgi:hypothetical protein